MGAVYSAFVGSKGRLPIVELRKVPKWSRQIFKGLDRDESQR